jgi:hypothetical protein
VEQLRKLYFLYSTTEATKLKIMEVSEYFTNMWDTLKSIKRFFFVKILRLESRGNKQAKISEWFYELENLVHLTHSKFL